MKRLPWSWVILALAGAAACAREPKPPSTFLPPAPTAEVEKVEPPVLKPYDPDVPEARPTTPVESAPLPPVRRR